MSRFEASIPSDYFDAMYAENPDPWHFSASMYEADKYAATLSALPRPRYHRALEIGCSIGIFTAALADRCNEVIAVDIVQTAIDQAATRCRLKTNVSFDMMRAPEEWPDGCFDLLVLSEVLYYFERADVTRLAQRAISCMEPESDIVLVHWTGETHYPLTADQAVRTFGQALGNLAAHHLTVRADEYRIDLYRRV